MRGLLRITPTVSALPHSLMSKESDGETALKMRQFHPNRQRRQTVVGFGAVQ
jgi:hypothetical protein